MDLEENGYGPPTGVGITDFAISSENHRIVTILGTMGVEPVHADRPLRLKNPPIVEAAIGITVLKLPSSLLERLKVAFPPDDAYKGRQQVTQSRLEMKIVEGQSTAFTNDEHLGWRWDSSDKLHAVQFKLDGFAFSRMGRYETWEIFIAEAKRLWDIYFAATGPAHVLEFGVRYINKVYIPVGVDINQYLRAYPKLPDEEKQWLLTESIMRLGVPIDSPEPGMFTHQQVLVPSDRPDHAAVILDNDFRYHPPNGINPSDLWSRIDAVRHVKDDYFRDLITPKLLETFNV
jgi:uncharacterized protein (TIGR04255 family)